MSKQHSGVIPSAITISILSLLILAVSCSDLNSNLYLTHKVDRQDEAGSVQVGVVDVVAWEDVASQLEANFKMDETTALQDAIPTTLLEQQQFVNALAITLKAAFGGTAFNNSTTSVITNGTLASKISSNSSQQTSGDVSQITTANPFNPSSSPVGLPSTATLGVDPLLARRAALTLLQSVRLMNRTIKDAALRTGYDPYIVTLQIGLTPYARNEPYDAYSALSFLPNVTNTPASNVANTPASLEDKIDENSSVPIPRQIQNLLNRDPAETQNDVEEEVGLTQSTRPFFQTSTAKLSNADTNTTPKTSPEEGPAPPPKGQPQPQSTVKSDGGDAGLVPSSPNYLQEIPLDDSGTAKNQMTPAGESHDSTSNSMVRTHAKPPDNLVPKTNQKDSIPTVAAPTTNAHPEVQPVANSGRETKGYPTSVLNEIKKYNQELIKYVNNTISSRPDYHFDESDLPSYTNSLEKVYQRIGLVDTDALNEVSVIARRIGAKLRSRTVKTQQSTPIVIPLLVTDDLEAAGEQRTSNFIQEFTLAASALIHGVSLSGESDSLNQKLEAVLGQDFNSLLTVGRLSENILQVRIGATLQGTSRYAMIPQTHNISLLLLVPHKKNSAALIARTTFRDAQSGKELPARTKGDINQLIVQVVEKYANGRFSSDPCISCKADLFSNVVSDVGQNNWVEYMKELARLEDRQPKSRLNDTELHSREITYPITGLMQYCYPLWTDLSALHLGSQYSSTTIRFGEGQPMTLPGPQSVLVVDDGKSSTVSLPGGDNMDAFKVLAKLTVTGTNSVLMTNSFYTTTAYGTPTTTYDSCPTAKVVTTTMTTKTYSNQMTVVSTNTLIAEHSIYATSTAVSDSGRLVQMTFPSLQASHLLGEAVSPAKDGQAKITTNVMVSLTLYGNYPFGQKRTSIYSNGVYILNTKPDAPPPVLSIDVPTERILADEKGHGHVQAVVSLVNTNAGTNNVSFYLMVHGADSLSDINGQPILYTIVSNSPPFLISTNIELSNLSESSPVTLVAITKTDGKTNGVPVLKYVQQLPIRREKLSP